MKLYRCNFYDTDSGCVVSWHSSERQARAALRELQQDRGEAAQGPEGVERVEVPTDRNGLIGWLNINLVSDNG